SSSPRWICGCFLGSWDPLPGSQEFREQLRIHRGLEDDRIDLPARSNLVPHVKSSASCLEVVNKEVFPVDLQPAIDIHGDTAPDQVQTVVQGVVDALRAAIGEDKVHGALGGAAGLNAEAEISEPSDAAAVTIGSDVPRGNDQQR